MVEKHNGHLSPSYTSMDMVRAVQRGADDCNPVASPLARLGLAADKPGPAPVAAPLFRRRRQQEARMPVPPPKPYVYQEFPKWVNGTIVQNAEEERRVRGERPEGESPANKPAEPRVSRGRRGRKPGSGSLDDDGALRRALRLLASGKVPSALAAVRRAVADTGKPNQSRPAEISRVYRKFRVRWGTEPPVGKTWADVEHEFDTN
jgi:hypothetical protein